MKHRFLLLLVTISIVTASTLLMAVPIAGQAPNPAVKATSTAKPWTPPKTPWGDPDLQGIYTSDDYIGVGLQRQPQFGDRLYLTEQEITQREATIANQAKNDLVDTVAPNARVGTGPPGHWGERAKRPPK